VPNRTGHSFDSPRDTAQFGLFDDHLLQRASRRDGKWIMVVGRDAPYVPGSNEDYLKDLEWLIGDWTLDAKDRPLRLHFEWMAQRDFIKNTYFVLGVLSAGLRVGRDRARAGCRFRPVDASGGLRASAEGSIRPAPHHAK
jgi:hypothetical protein